ncbi:MAG: trypsin-like serine protease [Nannocystaceae bacterium]
MPCRAAALAVLGAMLVAGCDTGAGRELGDDDRIIGGEKIDSRSAPWQVLLRTTDHAKQAKTVSCGGALVHPQWVLTTQECVDGLDAGDINVVAGTFYKKKKGASGWRTWGSSQPPKWKYRFAEQRDVAGLVVEEQAGTELLDGPPAGVALLKLDAPFTLGFHGEGDRARIEAIGLVDDPALLEPGALAVMSGHGVTDEADAEDSDAALEGGEDIAVSWLSWIVQEISGSSAKRIWAEGLEGEDTGWCSGDEGGPLVVEGPGGAPLLAGVADHKDECNDLDVYVSVVPFAKWIRERTNAEALGAHVLLDHFPVDPFSSAGA